MSRDAGSEDAMKSTAKAPARGTRTARSEEHLPRGIHVAQAPHGPIESLLLQMLDPAQIAPGLRFSLVEELGRPAKLANVSLQYLGLQAIETDREGKVPLTIVSPHADRPAWREALIVPGGDCPIGFVIETVDRGPLALVHEIFLQLEPAQKDLVRRSAALVVEGRTDAEILAAQVESFGGSPKLLATLVGTRKRVQDLDPSVLFSADGEIRVQLGSIAQTSRNLLREGQQAEHLFLLPSSLFEGRTNFGDVEFLVYLNFFIRQGRRTRLMGAPSLLARLERLLTLSLFGFFRPEDRKHSSFEALRDRYGVPDRATYEFLRMAYETFAVRRAGQGTPILGIADYVEFIPATARGTTTRIAKDDGRGEVLGEVFVKPAESGFDVRIVSADGHVTTKHLEVRPPMRSNRPIPAELSAAIRFATDRPRFGVTPLGTSHGFDPAGDVTSFVLWVGTKGFLVDPSVEALAYLDRIGVAPADIPYVFLTHIHADHDGGLIEKLLAGSRTTVIASEPVFRAFCEKARLVTGLDVEAERLVAHVSANPGRSVRIAVGGGEARIETRWNLHPIPTNGFKLSFEGKSFGYSGDTKYDRALLEDLRAHGALSQGQYDDLAHFFWDAATGAPTVDALYHEAGVAPIHTDKEQFASFSETIRSVTSLVHVADQDLPEGFHPGKPRIFGTSILLPPTEQSRRDVLLDALHRVGYLYDVSPAALASLLRGATLLSFNAGDAIIEKGPIRRGEPIYFFVMVDGEVAVQDGLMPVVSLVKGDSFGEWAISHQPGLRVADVTAVRPCQCLRFTQAQFRALVKRHPEIQARITKIRRLLPQLQTAQARSRLKSDPGSPGGRTLIETMTSNQLAGFALFSRVRRFRQGKSIIRRGERADGLYILLSGHTVVTVGKRRLGELGEGEVFGELGLLEAGRKRSATVTVVSDEADVLFMSARSYRKLIVTMPAFAWGLHETAARRRAPSPRPRGRRGSREIKS